jgi:hypothetical protein
MPESLIAPLWLALVGALLVAFGLVGLRRSGAQAEIGRRLAGARQVRVGELLAGQVLPQRAVRISGRIRCADPILTAAGDRLVALHRDVEVEDARGKWRIIERLRETRGFELWDHDGALAIDPADAAEPLVVIPHVWRGSPDGLGEDHQAALDRLASDGRELRAARSVTRMLSVVERLLVLADARRGSDGTVLLAPPAGGYVISALELDDAMRLLGGSRKGLLLASAGAIGLGAAALLVSAALLAAAWVGRAETGQSYHATEYQRGIESAGLHFYHPVTGSYQNLHSSRRRTWT